MGAEFSKLIPRRVNGMKRGMSNMLKALNYIIQLRLMDNAPSTIVEIAVHPLNEIKITKKTKDAARHKREREKGKLQ